MQIVYKLIIIRVYDGLNCVSRVCGLCNKFKLIIFVLYHFSRE
jgi:hypothetical protein